MKIRLNEIPQEGREYIFDRKSGELNDALSDLIEPDRPYDIDFFIKPIGNAFELRGKLKTTLKEICSSCGYEFDLPIQRKFNEILLEDQEDHRKNQGVHGNHSVDFLAEGPSMTPVHGDVFDAGEYVHEAIALAEPFYPMCGEEGRCLRQDEVQKIRERLEAENAEVEEKTAGHPAFSVLKGLDLKKKN